MHHPRETLIKPSVNPSYSHLTKKYRFDDNPAQSATTFSIFPKGKVMKIVGGFFSAILFITILFFGIHGQEQQGGSTTLQDNAETIQLSTKGPLRSTFAFGNDATTTSRAVPTKTMGKSCILPSNPTKATSLKQVTGNISDACLPGVKSKSCITWRMTNGIILKNSAMVDQNWQDILDFSNKTSTSCTSKSQMQFLGPQSDTNDCNKIFPMTSSTLARAMKNMDTSSLLVKHANDPGDELSVFLQHISECVSRNPPTAFDGAVLNIFTDITYLELCESQLFEGTWVDLKNKFIDNGFVIKFYFLNQNFQEGSEMFTVETLLNGCFYGRPQTFCEIVVGDSQMNYPEDFSICLTDAQDNKKSDDFNWQLLLIIGIPCISLTVCCIGFFICCLKCAKLKMAMMRMNIFNNDNPRSPEEMELKRKWFAKRKMLGKDLEHGKDCSEPGWSHFASANNYMDIQALASANKKDVWEIDTKNLLVQEDHLLGNGAFANVYKGIVKGKIPLLVVNNSLNLIVESEHNGHYEAAVKKLPAHADEQNHLDFFHEIDFMKRLGHHPHVISMLGCVSNPYEPLIVVEYCSRGDLLKFLRRHKDYVLMNKTDDCPVEADMCLRIKDLVSIAWQVADGMAYLSSKNFIHRDLAARNILLTKSLTAKISDFGLCRYMDSALYTAKGGRLPIKWMSIEALKLYEFSSKTDVWSFGVLLFELFSMGDVPYPTVQQMDMLEHLLAGGRLSQPLKCPNEIYQIMTRCWAEKPEDRPEFNEMRGEITVMLNLDDESYGYVSVQSDDGLPKYTSLTMQDSKETAPCSSMGNSREEEEYDSDNNSICSHEQATCHRLDEVLNEKYGEEQGQEIKKILCDVKDEMGRIKRVKSTHSNSTNRS